MLTTSVPAQNGVVGDLLVNATDLTNAINGQLVASDYYYTNADEMSFAGPGTGTTSMVLPPFATWCIDTDETVEVYITLNESGSSKSGTDADVPLITSLELEENGNVIAKQVYDPSSST